MVIGRVITVSKTIAIVNQCADVGKTTVAVNLAAALAVAEYRVLLIEGDPASEVAMTVDHPKGYDLLSVVKNELAIGRVIVASSLAKLDVLPATHRMWQFDLALMFVDDRQSLLARQIVKVRDLYDYLIIDCPSSLGLMTVNALLASSEVIIPVDNCRQGDFDQLLEAITMLDSLRMVNNRLSLLLNRTTEDYLMLNRRSIKSLTTVIPPDNNLAAAGALGLPVILHRADCLGSKVYMELAQEVIDSLVLKS